MITMTKTPATREFTLREARPNDADAMAHIMRIAIPWGRFKELGHAFSVLVQRHMVTSDHSICVVAEIDGKVVGYLTGTFDQRAFHRQFVRRHGVGAALRIVPRLWRPSLWRVLWRGLTYFPETANHDDPPSELISFVMLPECAGRGIGLALFEAVRRVYRERGVPLVKIGTVEATNDVANRFYEKLGCQLVRTEPFYRDSKANVYTFVP